MKLGRDKRKLTPPAFRTPCKVCSGAKSIFGRTCRRCRGTGYEPNQK